MPGPSQDDKLTYTDLSKFFIPIAISTMLMMLSHSIVSSALARTADPELSLAAYSVAWSITIMFLAPCNMVRRMAVSLFDNLESYCNTVKVAYTAFGITLAGMFILSFVVPFNRFIFVDLLGIKPYLLPRTVATFRVFLVLPFFATLRSIYQGVITLDRKTHLLTINMIARLAVMLGVTYILIKTNWVRGGVVGAVVLSSGIVTEAIMSYLTGRKLKYNFKEGANNQEIVDVKSAWLFFLPLVAAQLIRTFIRPSINAGLARTSDPALALASFQVARSLAWVFVAMGFRIHQLVLVYIKDKFTYRKVRRFILSLSIISSALLLLFSFTRPGYWILTTIIGVEPELATSALQTIAILAITPVLIALTELSSGLLMDNKSTGAITLSKITNLVTVVILVFLLNRYAPGLGGLIAGISLVSGYAVEMLTVLWKATPLVPADYANKQKDSGVSA